MNLTIVFLLAGATVMNNNDLLNVRPLSGGPMSSNLPHQVPQFPSTWHFADSRCSPSQSSVSLVPDSCPESVNLCVPFVYASPRDSLALLGHFPPVRISCCICPNVMGSLWGAKTPFTSLIWQVKQGKYEMSNLAGQSLAECEPVVCPLGGVYWAWGENKSFPVEKAQRKCSFAFLFPFYLFHPSPSPPLPPPTLKITVKQGTFLFLPPGRILSSLRLPQLE